MKWLICLALVALPAFADDGGVKPSVAALYFFNRSADEELGYFAKGLASLITADLVNSGTVAALDRERLEAVIAEKDLGLSKYADRASFGKLATVLAVDYLVTGTFTRYRGKLAMSVEVIHAPTTKVIAGKTVWLDPEDVFPAVQQISSFALEAVLKSTAKSEKVETPAKPKPGKLPYSTALKYAKALDAKDKKKPAEAKAMLTEVVKEQPDFQLAQLDLLALTK